MSGRPTLIRPPVVNRESSPAAGFSLFPREKGTTWGPRGAADFISRAASDTVVCTKHLLRLELETTTCSRHQRGEQPRLRGLETHLCPPAGRLKATGSGRRPVPVSTQLGRGAARSSSSQRRAIRCRASTGVQSTHRTPGPSRPDARPRSGPHVDPEHPLGLGPMLGPVRRPALPCSSSAFSRPGSPSSLLRHARRGVDDALGGHAVAFVAAPGRPAPLDFGRVKIAPPSRSFPAAPRPFSARGGAGRRRRSRKRTWSPRRPARGGACSRPRARACGRGS